MSVRPDRPSGALRTESLAATLRQLTALSRTMSYAPSLDGALGLVAREAAALLGAERTVLMLVGDDGMAHVRSSHGVSTELAATLGGKLDERIIDALEAALGTGPHAFLAVPMVVQGEVTGLLAAWRGGDAAWSEDDEALLTAIADQSAAPIEIARLSDEVRQARLVADNRRLTEDLQRRVAELEELLRIIPIGVAISADPACEVIRANPALRELLGASGPTASYRGDRPDRVPIEFQRDGRTLQPGEFTLRTAASTGRVVSPTELDIVWPDGRRTTVLASAAPVLAPDGTVTGAVGAFVDITERRRVEQQLRMAQRMESVGRLAGGMAHETNNQMSVVLGAAEFVLARQDLEPQVRADVEFMRNAAERTASITAQLLAFGRRQLMQPRVLDLNRVIGEMEPAIRRTIGAASTLEFRPGDELGQVRADRGQLEQVLLNLVLNSRDAMPDGGRLVIETEAAELDASDHARTGVAVIPGRYAVVRVTDTGHGMSTETLSHIFEPFFTTKEVGKGTGLGLAMAYGIVKQSNGYIWARSAPGEGTTFEVYLPRIEEPSAEGGAGRAVPTPAAGELILVVEDEPTVRTIARRSLELDGYQVATAGSGEEALEVLGTRGDAVALVITDVIMSSMNGRQLADEMQRRGHRQPVLFMSGYTDAEVIGRGLVAAGSPYIGKPFTPNALSARVRSLLETPAA